ncbi:MAG TPA: hypothetical protein VNR64_12420 [Vicinamibacterales bacterium]|nr:hypothetical protein [Vicinamibacterales bacterium]
MTTWLTRVRQSSHAVGQRLTQWRCRHVYRLAMKDGRMFLQCDCCPARTQGIEVYRPLRVARPASVRQLRRLK